jgi:hypothetical protein
MWNRACSAVLVVAAIFGATGCIAEPAGTQVWGVNESDHDVIVTWVLHGGTYVLPAHSWGKMFDTYALPSGEVRVYDTTCGHLATLPLTGPRHTVHIPPTGVLVMTGDSPGQVPLSVNRAPTGPGGNDSFAPTTCG